MKYLFKAISTNTRDLKTGIILIVEESKYMFNVPEGFCRLAWGNGIFVKSFPKYIFISSLHPDYFGGLAGLYLSGRKSLQSNTNFFITVLGPARLKEIMKAATPFLGAVPNLRLIEISEESAKKE